SLYVDRSVSADNSKLNIKSLIKNLKNIIMKKLSILYVTESFIFLSTLSVSFSAALSQSSTSVSMSDSSTSATSISVSDSSASAISAFSDSALSAFIINSSHFKKMLCRLNELHFSIKDIHVFRNKNADIILFYIYRYKTYTSYLRYYYKNELFTH
ncbi:hypothetical protein BDDG_13253, partial [Blastomyces dermatitidis ATCC 18188]